MVETKFFSSAHTSIHLLLTKPSRPTVVLAQLPDPDAPKAVKPSKTYKAPKVPKMAEIPEKVAIKVRKGHPVKAE